MPPQPCVPAHAYQMDDHVQVKPHIVYVTDDAALQQVAVPLLRHPPAGMSLSEFSVVFTGVNGDPTELYPDVFAEGVCVCVI